MHNSPSQSTPTQSRLILFGFGIALGCYAAAVSAGWPQYGRDLLVTAQTAHHASHDTSKNHYNEENNAEDDLHDDLHHDVSHEPHAGDPPPLLAVLPFVLLLGAIAIFPLTPALAHWWEHNSSKLLVAGILGCITIAYYLLLHDASIDLHFPAHAITPPAENGPSWGLAGTVLANALLAEYVPFIMLLLSLYVITGGVRIEGDLEATPTTNAVFLLIGTALASFIGTTGAAMLLIRPLLETNQQRRGVVHTLVFFIFMVCNCGGCLLPIGDPPLFLGYLQGVDFLWTMSLWKEWLVTNGILLAVYWLWDSFYSYPHEKKSDIAYDTRRTRALKISGLAINAPLMLGVIAAVGVLDPSKAVPGTDWHPWIFLREAVLLSLVTTSLALGSSDIREKNGFSYFAILEVAALFVGIFVCMQPALAILNTHGASLGIRSPQAFFWATGSLSAVLDNAPTYLVFFKTAQALPAEGTLEAGVEIGRLTGISLGAVFLGAMTYIGNGPNFMVKAIAEQSGIRMPSFFGYLLYSLAVLIPVFVLVSFIFL